MNAVIYLALAREYGSIHRYRSVGIIGCCHGRALANYLATLLNITIPSAKISNETNRLK